MVHQKSHESESSWTQRASSLCTVVGAACLWAWGYVANLSTALFPSADVVTSIGIEFAYYTSQLTLFLLAVGIALALRRRHPRISPAIVMGAAVCLAASSWAISALMQVPAVASSSAGQTQLSSTVLGNLPDATQAGAPLAAIIICGVVYGAGGLVLTVAWGARFSLGPRSMRRLVLLSFLLGYGIYLAMPVIPGSGSTLVTCMLPLVSGGLWLLDSWRRHTLTHEVWPGTRTPGEASAGLTNASLLPWRTMALFALAALVGNFVTSLLMGSTYSGAATIFPGGFLVCGCITTAALITVAQGAARLEIELLYRYCLPFSVLGMLFVLVMPAESHALAGALVTGASLFLQALVILKVTESAQETGASPLLAYSAGQGIIGAVVCLGNVGGRMVSALPDAEETWLPMACAAGVFLLFYLLVLTADALAQKISGTTSSDEEIPAPTGGARAQTFPDTHDEADSQTEQPALAARLDSFAADLGLTPREAQVCLYLVQGRTLPFIAEQLYVTPGTVKTHALHVYRKAGVSNKQELISAFAQKGIAAQGTAETER